MTARGGAFLLGVAVWFGCAGASPEPAPQQAADQQISDFSIAGYGEKGKKTWDLKGESADILEQTVKLKNLTGQLYGADENVTLVADKGDFNRSSGTVHLEDNVVITTTSGARLTTDSLDWDRQKQVVSTPDQVNIQKENMVTVATGATGHPNLNTMTLEKNVTVTMTPAELTGAAPEAAPAAGTGQDRIVITCDGPLDIDYQKNMARFNNNVKAEKEDSTIYADAMELYFGKNMDAKPKAEASGSFSNSKIDKIVCLGNVKIVRGENVSYCEEAVYNAADQKISLRGKPKLVIYSTEDFKQAFGP